MDYQKIKQIIDEWDPIELLAMDCPEDEYEPEIKRLAKQLSNRFNTDEAAKTIFDVFIEMFGADIFTEDLSRCREIALKILG